MIDRALIALALLLAGALIFYWLKRLTISVDGAAGDEKPWLDSLRVSGTLPALVYFYTPQCVACRVRQKPAVDQVRLTLERREYDASVVMVDASQDVALADAMRVRTVPSTIVVNHQGEIKARNTGAVDAEKLLKQI